MSLCNLNTNSFSVETCISDLVKISLKKRASSIAVRFSTENRKIQVVDNGIGFTKFELGYILDEEARKTDESTTLFEKINILSKTIIVTSRSECSPRTYVKIASDNGCCRFFEGHHRPSKGTTVTIYDFNSSSWNNGDKINCSISYVIAATALLESQVSFSVRNDDEKKMILNLKQPHNPWEVLYYLKKNKSYTSTHQLINQIVDESAINYSPESLEKASDSRSLKVSLKLLTDDQTDITNNDNLSSPISEWSILSYDTETSNNNRSANDHCNKEMNNLSNMNPFDENCIRLSQLSVWSDWFYEPETSIKCVMKKSKVRKRKKIIDPRSKFLPENIQRMLPQVTLLADKKLIQPSQQHLAIDILEDKRWKTTVEERSRYFQNVRRIKIDDVKRRLNECRISANTIDSLQILRQINKEFIAAITTENGRKLLIIIDQHAVHERIRYEYLIETYKDNKTQEYYSMKLDAELVISDIDEDSLRLISSRKEILHRVGLNIKSIVDSTTCSVDYVPMCFMKRIRNYNNDYNLYRLIKNIRLLILEVARGLGISESILPPVLPITINNVIAGEACHEAIKFGDPLSVKECTLLIRALQDTKGPTRCAHGRPSMIPLMDLSDLKRWKCPTKV